ncbi:MAG TPA: hypothetical protein ENJ84_09030 [Gammaproteobacteria bacterium]|nr:hypothetical protein [Gammaproteobacteria bacterium]
MAGIFRNFIASVFVGAFIAPSFLSAETTQQQTQIPEFKVPDDVQSDGAFRYKLPFDLPEYRGLVPGFGISYNSSFKGHGGAEVWMGAGWRLSGFSSIERVTIGGGTPTYNDTRDLYRLDGTELLACNDTAATNPWPSTRGYPDRYKTDNPSASCSAGGNLAPIVENYRKIEMKQQAYGGGQVDYFVVTARDGTQYRYDSIGVLAGETLVPSNWKKYGLLFQRKFLLSEIRDTQATPNVVTISYQFSALSKGRAYRPRHIAYGGYNIWLNYSYHDTPLATYATGTTGFLGQQNWRLETVIIRDGSKTIGAYGFEYTQSAQSGTTLLNRVRAYGKNVTTSNGMITGGDELPSPLKNLTYSADQTSFTEVEYPDENFHRGMIVQDYDRDGRDELIFPSEIVRGYEVDGGPNFPGYTLASEATDIGFDRFLNLATPHPKLAALGTPTNSIHPSSTLSGFSGFHPVDNQTYFFLVSNYPRESGGNDPDWHDHRYLEGYGLTPQTSKLSSMYFGRDINKTFVYGNYDDDPEPEAIGQYYYLYDINEGTLEYKNASRILADGTFADIDGDSVLEQVGKNLKGTIPGYPGQWIVQDSYNGSFIPHGIPKPDTGINSSQEIVKYQYGDVNGDGASDLIMFNIRQYLPPRVYVALSSGTGFEPRQLWGDSASLPILGTLAYWQPSHMQNRAGAIQIRDVNADGFADLIIHDGVERDSTPYWHQLLPYGELPAHIFLSNGTSFVADGTQDIQDFLGLADVDGDGLADVVAEKDTAGGRKSRIYYSDGPVPNLLKSLSDNKGGVTRIAYMPSSAAAAGGNPGSKVPAVTQVVQAIERENGRGDVRRTTFTYTGAEYDYNNRRPLGYKTVTASLPAISGETAGPKVVTFYHNAHIAEHGHIRQQIVTTGDTVVWQKTTNDWQFATTGNGPYRAQKLQTRKATQYGTDSSGNPVLLETAKSYSYDIFGNPETITEYGFTSNGTNLGTGDDMITSIEYIRNLSNYIVNTPKSKRTEPGTVSTWNWSRFLGFESYTYDGAANENTPPVRGNLTKTRVWTGDPNAPDTRRVVNTLTYDDFGNVLSETNARGATNAYTYDAGKHLFRTGTVNPLGHSTSTQWDTRCQAPTSTTDINGQLTRYEYDTFCREIRQILPSGRYLYTYYRNFGNPAQQYIQKYTRSSSNVAGRTYQYSREFFDGFGEVYKTASSGNTAQQNDLIATLTGYDARGNKSWASNPMTWADAANNQAAPGQRTTYEYDTLGRLTKTTNPDGSYSHVDRSGRAISRYGAVFSVPAVRSRNADCFDGDQTTTCNDVYRLYDYRGNLIREDRFDSGNTDVNTGASRWRSTSYVFDLRNNLTAVYDPAGANWHYTYDVFGNRTVADDPDLGTWTLAYDENNNLTSQFDAKGQEIRFTYDALDRVTAKSVYKSDGTLESRILSTYDEPNPSYSNIGQLTNISDLNGNAIRYYYDKKQGLLQREHHLIDGKTYIIHRSFRVTGDLNRILLPSKPGTTAREWLPLLEYDSANRLKSFGSYITNIDYDLRSNPTQVTYGNGASETRGYNPERGWIERIDTLDASLNLLDRTEYTRSASGRVYRQNTTRPEGKFDYAYDYAGRLLSATNWGGVVGYDQTFTYDAAGSMRSNSALGTYDYGAPTAAHPHAPTAVGLDQFTYDANGNMTTGLGGKVMTYDAENRPLTVSHNGTTTTYVYGPDGTRLKKTEGTDTTAYFGPVEIRHFGQGTGEEILLYPHPNVRLALTNTGGQVERRASYLHSDQLGSVRVVTGADGASDREVSYRPFGEAVEFVTDPAAVPETKGFIGERFDPNAGLQYLNARYYDPKLGMFIQPDWFEVTMAGVGTNRYAYVGNNPINISDPKGNCPWCFVGAIIGAWLGSSEPANAPGPDDETIHQSAAQTVTNMAAGATGGMMAGALIEECLGSKVCRLGARVKSTKEDDQGSIVPHDTQVASSYPKDRIVGGKGEGRRATDPEVGIVESGSWELTQENIERMERGRPPIGADGKPIVIHHRNQSPEGPFDEMTSTSHRGVDHPLSPSRIDRNIFQGEKRRYWRERIRKILGQ